MKNDGRFYLASVVVLVLVALAAVAFFALTPGSVVLADPVAQTVSESRTVILADGTSSYTGDYDDTRVVGIVEHYGVIDMYASAVLTETDQVLFELYHGPCDDSAPEWVKHSTWMTETDTTATPQHMRVASYGNCVKVRMDLSTASIIYTPTVVLVLKNNAGGD